MTYSRTENALFLGENVMQNRESTSRVHACEARVHPALFILAFAAYARMAAHLPPGIFYCMPLRKLPGTLSLATKICRPG